MRTVGMHLLLVFAFYPKAARAGEFALFDRLSAKAAPSLICYTPSELDPRQEANQRRLQTSSIRLDLEALRANFDGLVLYGYHEACTPRIMAVAKDLGFSVM